MRTFASPLKNKATLTKSSVAEWSIAAVLKTVVPRGTRGSNPCLSAIKGVNQVVTRFAPFFTPKKSRLVYFLIFKINAGEKRRMSIFLFSSASFLSAAQAKISLVRFRYIAKGVNQTYQLKIFLNPL